MCAVRRAVLAVIVSMLGAGAAIAQADLAKVLVGTWEGELQLRTKKGADLGLKLGIMSVKQEDGKGIADGRFGGSPVKIDVDPGGSKPSLRWTGATGATYNVSLLDDKNLAGTVTLTTSAAGRGDRDRSVKLEKKE
jgi:carbohydrate-selective porin OprB